MVYIFPYIPTNEGMKNYVFMEILIPQMKILFKRLQPQDLCDSQSLTNRFPKLDSVGAVNKKMFYGFRIKSAEYTQIWTYPTHAQKTIPCK